MSDKSSTCASLGDSGIHSESDVTSEDLEIKSTSAISINSKVTKTTDQLKNKTYTVKNIRKHIPDICVTSANCSLDDNSNTNVCLKHSEIVAESRIMLKNVKLQSDNINLVSSTPLKAVKVTRRVFSPPTKKDDDVIDVPRITVTKATPVVKQKKIKKVSSPVLEYIRGNAQVIGKKIVLEEDSD